MSHVSTPEYAGDVNRNRVGAGLAIVFDLFPEAGQRVFCGAGNSRASTNPALEKYALTLTPMDITLTPKPAVPTTQPQKSIRTKTCCPNRPNVPNNQPAKIDPPKTCCPNRLNVPNQNKGSMLETLPPP
jgi:hypothetical protein